MRSEVSPLLWTRLFMHIVFHNLLAIDSLCLNEVSRIPHVISPVLAQTSMQPGPSTTLPEILFSYTKTQCIKSFCFFEPDLFTPIILGA